MQKKKKKAIIYLISGIIILAIVVGSFFIFKKKSSSSSSSNSEKPANSPKKVLAQKVKQIIKKDLEKVKKYVIENDNFQNFMGFILIHKTKERYSKDSFEKEDYDEIVNLIKQITDLNKERIKEREAEIDKTEKEEKCFYFLFKGKGLWKGKEEKTYCSFQKKHSQGLYQLKIIADHPVLANYSFADGIGDEKTQRFYLIDGVDFNSFKKITVPNPNFFLFRKEVEAEDKITIVPSTL